MSSRPRVPFGVIGFGAVAAAAALFLVIGAPRDRSAPRAAPTPEAAAVSAGGVTLAAVSAELPSDDATFPAGPGVDAVQANCTSCHSAAMILSQPPLKPEQWQAVVEKMQKAYHAPVDPAAVPGILAYLASLSPSGASRVGHAPGMASTARGAVDPERVAERSEVGRGAVSHTPDSPSPPAASRLRPLP